MIIDYDIYRPIYSLQHNNYKLLCTTNTQNMQLNLNQWALTNCQWQVTSQQANKKPACAHECMYHMYARMCTCKYACMQICVHAHMYACTHACIRDWDSHWFWDWQSGIHAIPRLRPLSGLVPISNGSTNNCNRADDSNSLSTTITSATATQQHYTQQP